MKCTIKGCPGHYEPRVTSQIFKSKGYDVVVSDIPVTVCDICGDTLVDPETARKIHEALRSDREADATVPVYRLAV
jgi:YgiT-type zinc finger domain-containing protein